VCFFGDGASNRGTFHEALNMAAAWQLPVIFACENNRYASTTPFSPAGKTDLLGQTAPWPVHSTSDLARRAAGYNMPGTVVDGNDVLAVYHAAGQAIARARQGGGPTLLEFRTYRAKGHFIGDPEKYRARQEVEEMFRHEPIGRFRQVLLEAALATEKELDDIAKAANDEVEAAVQYAEASPDPEPQAAFEDVYA
jgi:pyruvate dehydrogenase E1 component alpha subunit